MDQQMQPIISFNPHTATLESLWNHYRPTSSRNEETEEDLDFKAFKNNIAEYCKVVSIIITSIDNRTDLLSVIKNKDVFQRDLMEREDFYITFFGGLFPSFVEVLVKFSKDSEIFQELSFIIQKFLFKKNIKAFEHHLNSDDKSTYEGQHLVKLLLKFLKSAYAWHDEKANCSFKLIFHSLAGAFNKFEFVFKILVAISELIGFELKQHFNLGKIVKSPAADVSLEKSLGIVAEMLDVIAKMRVELDCKFNEITFEDFLQDLLKSVMVLSKNPSVNSYKILLRIIEIDPLILERVLSSIISFAMLGDNSSLLKEYEEVMIRILEVFAKLHRVQNFISKMIPVVKQELNGRNLGETVYEFSGISLFFAQSDIAKLDIDFILPINVLRYFASCVTSLTSWQTINLFRTLLHHLRAALEDLRADKNDDSKVTYVEILCAFMSWLLLSIPLSVQQSSLENLIKGWKELKGMLSEFGRILLHREHNYVLMRSYLSLGNYWAEIYITLQHLTPDIEIEPKKSVDDYSPSGLSYLHSYLSEKEWCSISERLTNFGEEPLIHRLYVQEFRAIGLFEGLNENILTSFSKMLSTASVKNSTEIFLDPFVVKNLLPVMPQSFILNIAEVVVKDFTNGDFKASSKIYDSPLILDQVICVICSKLSKALRQKRSHDEDSAKTPLFSKILPIANDFLFDVEQVQTMNELLRRDSGYLLKINDNSKIVLLLDVLKKVVDPYLPEATVKFVLIMLFAFLKDIAKSSGELRGNCEDIILDLVQYSKFNLFSIIDAENFLRFTTGNFDKFGQLFSIVIGNIIDINGNVQDLEPVVTYLKANLKEDRNLKCGTIALHFLGKAKRTKISAESKALCLNYQSAIFNKIVKIINKETPNDRLIEPYALAFKHFISKDENANLSKLKNHLNDYMQLCVSGECPRGSLSLYLIILHNRSILDELEDNPTKKIWNHIMKITVSNDDLEEYTQVVTLLASSVPSDDFPKFSNDLLRRSENACEERNVEEISKYLKIWTGILSCNFNPVKTKVICEQLEMILLRLIVLFRNEAYDKKLFDEMVQFQAAIFQTSQLALTSTMIDFFLLTVSILMTRVDDGFINIYNSCMLLLQSLLKHHNSVIMDRLSPYLQRYRLLFRELCKRSNVNLNMESGSIDEISGCAYLLEKLTNKLVANTKDMKRIAPYLIADILEQYELYTLHPSVKQHLNNCVVSLISLCDHHSVQFLMRVLSNASTEIFKIMHKDYTKHKFTGKA